MNESAGHEIESAAVATAEAGGGGSVEDAASSEPVPAEVPGVPNKRAAVGEDDVIGAVEHELTVLLRRARAVSKDFARLVHPELESDAYGLLIRLAEVHGARGTDLAAYFGIGKPTISRQVKELEELGLIERQAQEGDARASVLVLTEDGQARFRRMRDARRERFGTLLSDWDAADVEQFAALLRRWNGSTGEPR